MASFPILFTVKIYEINQPEAPAQFLHDFIMLEAESSMDYNSLLRTLLVAPNFKQWSSDSDGRYGTGFPPKLIWGKNGSEPKDWPEETPVVMKNWDALREMLKRRVGRDMLQISIYLWAEGESSED